MHYNTIRW